MRHETGPHPDLVNFVEVVWLERRQHVDLPPPVPDPVAVAEESVAHGWTRPRQRLGVDARHRDVGRFEGRSGGDEVDVAWIVDVGEVVRVVDGDGPMGDPGVTEQ